MEAALTLTLEQRESIRIVSGGVHQQLALAAAKLLTPEEYGDPVDPSKHQPFPNSEQYPALGKSMRGKEVFIIQSQVAHNGGTVDSSIVETNLMIDAARRASAREITVVAPLLGYMRQDRKTEGRAPISGAWNIKTLDRSGADRFVTIDMHSPQLAAVTDKPFDLLPANQLIDEELRAIIGDQDPERFIIIAPDAGALRRCEEHADELGLDVTWMPKTRSRSDPSIVTRHEINKQLVEGRVCIVIDDMVDSGKTLEGAVVMLKSLGAKNVIIAATHGIFSQGGAQRLASAKFESKPAIDEFIITDTVPQQGFQRHFNGRLRVVSVAPLLARAIREITLDGSISERMFAGRNYS